MIASIGLKCISKYIFEATHVGKYGVDLKRLYNGILCPEFSEKEYHHELIYICGPLNIIKMLKNYELYPYRSLAIKVHPNYDMSYKIKLRLMSSLKTLFWKERILILTLIWEPIKVVLYLIKSIPSFVSIKSWVSYSKKLYSHLRFSIIIAIFGPEQSK